MRESVSTSASVMAVSSVRGRDGTRLQGAVSDDFRCPAPLSLDSRCEAGSASEPSSPRKPEGPGGRPAGPCKAFRPGVESSESPARPQAGLGDGDGRGRRSQEPPAEKAIRPGTDESPLSERGALRMTSRGGRFRGLYEPGTPRPRETHRPDSLGISISFHSSHLDLGHESAGQDHG
jgi:hypothetical protein